MRNMLLAAAELAKICEQLKKELFHGHPLNRGDLFTKLVGLQATLSDSIRSIHHEHESFRFNEDAHISEDWFKMAFVKELGDIAWYTQLAATALDTPLSEVLEQNIEKLRRRYPEGFSSERSIHRTE